MQSINSSHNRNILPEQQKEHASKEHFEIVEEQHLERVRK
jgi:hypothetical protein